MDNFPQKLAPCIQIKPPRKSLGNNSSSRFYGGFSRRRSYKNGHVPWFLPWFRWYKFEAKIL